MNKESLNSNAQQERADAERTGVNVDLGRNDIEFKRNLGKKAIRAALIAMAATSIFSLADTMKKSSQKAPNSPKSATEYDIDSNDGGAGDYNPGWLEKATQRVNEDNNINRNPESSPWGEASPMDLTPEMPESSIQQGQEIAPENAEPKSYKSEKEVLADRQAEKEEKEKRLHDERVSRVYEATFGSKSNSLSEDEVKEKMEQVEQMVEVFEKTEKNSKKSSILMDAKEAHRKYLKEKEQAAIDEAKKHTSVQLKQEAPKPTPNPYPVFEYTTPTPIPPDPGPMYQSKQPVTDPLYDPIPTPGSSDPTLGSSDPTPELPPADHTDGDPNPNRR